MNKHDAQTDDYNKKTNENNNEQTRCRAIRWKYPFGRRASHMQSVEVAHRQVVIREISCTHTKRRRRKKKKKRGAVVT